MPVTAFTGREAVLPVWDGRLRLHVKILGSGPPLVYLHPAAGLVWDSVLDALAQTHTVYAPEHPGTSADPTAIHQVDTWSELLLIYEELFRTLALDRPVVVGPSYGGMLAADLAATFPGLVGRLVLLDPIGLWRDDAPIPLMQLISSLPAQIPPQLFHDVNSEGARSLFTPSPDPELAIRLGAAFVWALGCAGKFIWPIADHGLARRLHRIRAPTLILWGRQDALVPVVYAEEFARRIEGARVALIDRCGHLPQLERAAETLAQLHAFLASPESCAARQEPPP